MEISDDRVSIGVSNGLIALPFGVVIILLELVFGWHSWFISAESLPSGLPEIVLPIAMYGIGALCLIIGLGRKTTTFDGKKKKVSFTQSFLFVPVYSSSIKFSDIRYIDFHHSAGENLPDSHFTMFVNYIYWGRMYFLLTGAGDATPYEVYVFTEDRDRIFVYMGYGRERVMKVADAISRLTGRRIG